MLDHISFIVAPSSPKLRIVDYILRYHKQDHLSRNYLKKLISAKCLLIEGKPAHTANYALEGQCIDILPLDKIPHKIFRLEFPVIFEDDFIAVVNKPAGIPVSGNQFKTLQNAVLHNITPAAIPHALALPLPVHRLDALTSGLLIIAKTRPVRQILGKMLQNHQIDKSYQAIVMGKTPPIGTFDSPIDGKPALTDFSTLRQINSLHHGWISWLNINLHTGRTHQIRIHLSQAGFPVLGDKLYSPLGTVYKGKGLFLSATSLKFMHPIKKEQLNFNIEPPHKFALYLQRQTPR